MVSYMQGFASGLTTGERSKAVLQKELNKAKKLLEKCLQYLDYEDNQGEAIDFKYEVEKFLKKGKKK